MQRDQFFDAACPILWTTGVPDYPLSYGGTCFIAKFAGSLFAVTASHCISGQDANALFVPYRRAPDRPFRTRHIRYAIPEVREEDHIDYGDLAFISLQPPDGADALTVFDEAIDLEPAMCGDPSFHLGDTLGVGGFPVVLSTYPPDGPVQRGELRAKGSYAGMPRMSWGCHTMEANLPNTITDLKGLSGAPVCWAGPGQWEHGAVHFAGVAIRAGASSGKVHFIGADNVRALLRIILAPPSGSVRADGAVLVTPELVSDMRG